MINTGEISNSGVEGRLEATVLKTPDFQWDLSFNASTNESEVEDFPGDITTQVLGTSRSGVQVVNYFNWADVDRHMQRNPDAVLNVITEDQRRRGPTRQRRS